MDTNAIIEFDAYHDGHGRGCTGEFAVLTNPGPNTPKGCMAAAQDAVDQAVQDGSLEMEAGDAIEPAGLVSWNDEGELEAELY